jgi:autotransporter-associated beta strand protein
MNIASMVKVRRRKMLAASVAVVSALSLSKLPTYAGISIVDPSTNFGIGYNTGGSANDGADGTITQSDTFTVSPTANVLVVQFGELYQPGDNPNVAITWTPTGGTAQPLSLGIQQISAATSHVLSEVLYLNTPVAGSGTLGISAFGRTDEVGAFTLNGVNTAIAPVVQGVDGGTTSDSITLGAGTSSGSFAAVAEGFRVNAGGTTPFTLTSTSGTATQQYSNIDAPDSVAQYGGGVVSGLGAGASTITESDTNVTSRNELAVAVFTPLPNAGPFTWVGGGGSGGNASWDTTATTTNWKLTASGAPTAYTDGGFVTFDDNGANPNITIASPGVNPLSITFANLMNAYTLSGSPIGNSGANPTTITLTGGGAVTLNGSNTYTGGTTITNGMLTAGSNTALGTGPVTMAAGNSLNFTSNNPTIGSLGGAGTVTLGQSTAGTTALVINGTLATFAGTINDLNTGLGEIGSLTISGTGVMTLSAPAGSTYSGGTTVGPGELMVTNTSGSATGTGGVTVNGPGILAGSGFIVPTGGLSAGGVTLGSGSHLAPHVSATVGSTLTLGSATAQTTFSLNTGVVLDYNLAGIGSSDTVNVNGNLALGTAAANTLNITRLAGLADGNYPIVSFTGTLSGSTTWTINAPGEPAALNFAVDPTGIANQLTLRVTSPSEYIWTGLAGASGAANWDTTTSNWTGFAATYNDGKPLIFDNTGTNPTITLASTVSPASLLFSNTATVTYSITGGVIAGATTTVTQNGAGGTVILGGTNTYGGGTTLTAGIFKTASAQALSTTAGGNTGTITVASGAMLDLNGQTLVATTPAISSIAGTGVGGVGAITNSSTTAANFPGAITLTGATSFGGANPFTLSGAIGGANTLTKVGAGILTLSGSNSYGGTTVSTGTLQAGNAQAFGITGPISVASGSTIDFNGKTMSATTPAISVTGAGVATGALVNNSATAANYSGAITLTGATTVGGSGTLTLGGAIGGGTFALTKAGTGTTILGTAEAYTGGTNVNNGTLRLGPAGALNATGNLAVNGGGTFDLGGANLTVPGLSGGGILTNSVTGASTLTVTGTNTFNGVLTDGGAGKTLTLAVPTGATLTLNSTNSTSNSTGGATIASGARLNAIGATSLGAGPISLNGGLLSIGAQAGVTPTYLTNLGPTNALATAANFQLNGNATFPSAGILRLSLAGGGGQAGSAFFTTKQTLPNLTTNTGFTANFTYQIATNLTNAADGAAFILQNDTNAAKALGGGGGSLGYQGINNSFAFEMNVFANNTVGIATRSSGSTPITGSPYTPTTNTTGASPNLASGDPIAVSLNYNGATTAMTETLTDTTTLASYTTTLNVSSATGSSIASILGGNAFYVGFSGGTGGQDTTQTITNFSFSSGVSSATTASIANAINVNGTSTLENNAGTGVPVTVGAVNFAAGSTLNITAGTAMTSGTAYAVTGGATTLAGNSTVNVANNGTGVGSLTLSAITDGGTNASLTKTGPGVLFLTGPSTYGGGTNVQQGTLAGNGSLGKIGSTISVSSSAALAPSALQTITAAHASQLFITGNVTLSSGATYGASLARPDNGSNAGIDYDTTIFSNALTLTGSILAINDTAYATGTTAPVVGDKFYVLDGSALGGPTVTGMFSNAPTQNAMYTSPNNLIYQVTYDASNDPQTTGQDVLLTFEGTATPEPASLGLLGLGAIGLLTRRRRRGMK